MQQAIDTYRSNPEFAKQSDEIMQALLVRSATDAAFRAKLVSDAPGAFAEFTGRDRSEFANVNIRFVENKADATLVLPPAVDSSAELSDSELESVAGGTELCCAMIVGAVLTAVLVGVQAAN